MPQPIDDVKTVIPKLIDTVRYSVAVSAHDINFYRTIDAEIDGISSDFSDLLLRLLDNLADRVHQDKHPLHTKSKLIWEQVESSLDSIYEKVDIATEKRTIKIQDVQESGLQSTASGDIEKPQHKFEDEVNNSDISPFVPKLTSKPFALEPLDVLLRCDANGLYPQPYEHEIMSQPYPEEILVVSEPIKPHDWDSKEAIMVSTKDQLKEMVETLQSSKQIAVDLEHHDLRSYYGITCLMQISDRNQDWLVDVLALRSEMEILNTVFADPKIVKVFHGAFMDIIWLQRDFGLYVVSLFDTYHAAKLLGFPKLSLAYLLDRFAGFKASKKFQLADWRIRPLSSSMAKYARADTHYLLYIYDSLRNLLVTEDNSKLKLVLHSSRKVALRRFEYIRFRNLDSEFIDEATQIMRNYNISIKYEAHVRQISAWRDKLARDLDESPRYLMPNSVLVKLSIGEMPANVLTLHRVSNVNLDKEALESLVQLVRSAHSRNLQNVDLNNGLEEDVPQLRQRSVNDLLDGQSQLLLSNGDLLHHQSIIFSARLLVRIPRATTGKVIKPKGAFELMPYTPSPSTTSAEETLNICPPQIEAEEMTREDEDHMFVQAIKEHRKSTHQNERKASRVEVKSPNFLNYEKALQDQNVQKETAKLRKRKELFDPNHQNFGREKQKRRRFVGGKSAAFTK